jgi:predicted PurR-regulated permease PerM
MNEGGEAALPPWLRTAGAASWRLLGIAGVVLAVLYLLALLRVVVLPVIVALLATTLLLPPVRALQKRGVPPAAAVAIAMVGAVLVLAGILAAIAPSIGNQADELGTGVQNGVRQVTDVLADKPFNLSKSELRDRVDEGLKKLRQNSGPLTHGVQSGAVILGEIVTGLIITVLLTFFFLKDGREMWDWLIGLFGAERQEKWDDAGQRVFTALGGYVRGIALVGFVDAVLIGIALLILGVPLVVPLMILTFFGAFLPLIGAFLAGLASVLIALVAKGVVTALIVLGCIILVQQIEGHLLYPLLMSRTVNLHPAVIIVSLGIGGVLAGIIGVFLAVPAAGVISVLISFARDEPPPQSPVAEPPEGSEDPSPGEGNVAGAGA